MILSHYLKNGFFGNQMHLSHNENRITGILLAAGGSRRLGRPKQLLPLKNGNLINFIIQRVLESGLSDLIIVLGCCDSEIKKTISSQNVITVVNEKWEDGISGSIKCGLKAVNKNTQAVIFFIVDQPFLETQLILHIINKSYFSKAEIITAEVDNQLTHPVLFRREIFPELLNLEGDAGGKTIFHRHHVETIHWGDARLLVDVDRIEDYEKLIDQNH